MSDVSRRDFIKVTGAGVAGLAGAVALGKLGLEITESFEDVPIDFDFVNNPSIWEGNKGEKFGEELSNHLFTEHSELYPGVRQDVLEVQGVDIGELNQEKIGESISKLLSETVIRGRELNLARKKGLTDIEDVLVARYEEVASYTAMLRSIYEYSDMMGFSSFMVNLYAELKLESLADGFNNTTFGSDVNRRGNTSLWNVDWVLLAKGENDYSPLIEVFASPDGNIFKSDALGHSVDTYLDKPIIKVGVQEDASLFVDRPKETDFHNFTPEVQDKIAKRLDDIGILRAIGELSYKQEGGFGGATEQRGDKVHVYINSPEEVLSLEEYLAVELKVLNIVVHEGYHEFRKRAVHLSREDQLRVRNLEYQIYKKIDPLQDTKRIFDPEGEAHNFLVDNESSLVGYPFEHLHDYRNKHGVNLHSFLTEFSAVMDGLTGESLDSIWNIEGRNTEYMEFSEILDELEVKAVDMSGVTKLLAETILEQKDAIISRRVFSMWQYYAGKKENADFEMGVVPAALAHLIMYKPNELIKVMSPEKHKKDKGYGKNYITSLHKRIREFVRGKAGEELLATAFAGVMTLEKGETHEISYLNEVKESFEEIIEIYKKNDLL